MKAKGNFTDREPIVAVPAVPHSQSLLDLSEIIDASKLGCKAVDAEEAALVARNNETHNTSVQSVIQAVSGVISILYKERWGQDRAVASPSLDSTGVYQEAEILGLDLPTERPVTISAAECARLADHYMATAKDIREAAEPHRQRALRVLGRVLKGFSLRPVDVLGVLVCQAVEHPNKKRNLSLKNNGVIVKAVWVSPGCYFITATSDVS